MFATILAKILAIKTVFLGLVVPLFSLLVVAPSHEKFFFPLVVPSKEIPLRKITFLSFFQ